MDGNSAVTKERREIMENIEILTHQALQSIDWKMRDQNEVNWEQRRYEIAKEAMNGLLSAPVVDGVNPNPSFKDVATFSVRLADALIKELKGGEE